MTSWNIVELGEVSNFVRGINFKPEDVVPLGTPGSVGCLRTSNVQSEVDLADVWGVPESFVRRPEQMLRHGDILVSSANSWNLVGKCCWIPELPWRASFGGFVSVLRADTARVEPRFLYRWFSSTRIQTTLRSFGRQTTNISNLSIERCLGLGLPLPPLVEQRRIADILDMADELNAKRRAALAQLDGLAQSVFVEMFGDPVCIKEKWGVVELGAVLNFLTSGSRGWAAHYAEAGDLFLRIQNVGHDDLRMEDVAFVKAPDTTEARRTKVASGDVLLSITADLGRTAVVPEGLGAAFINQHLAILRTRAFVPRFLSAFLSSPSGQAQVLSKNRQGVKAGLNFDDIRSLQIPSPPISRQQEFSVRMDKLAGFALLQRS